MTNLSLFYSSILRVRVVDMMEENAKRFIRPLFLILFMNLYAFIGYPLDSNSPSKE